jgi:hypothetical protein
MRGDRFFHSPNIHAQGLKFTIQGGFSHMSANFPVFTAKDFAQYQWEGVLNTAVVKEYTEYNHPFYLRAEEARYPDNKIEAEIFNFLQNLTSPSGLCLQWIGEKYRLKTLTGYLKGIKHDFYEKVFLDEHFEILKQLVDITFDPEMKARMADILWICKPNLGLQTIKTAVEAYLQSARNLEDIEHWNRSADRLHRAAQLAMLADGKKLIEMCSLVANHIYDLIERHRTEKFEFLTGSAMSVLFHELRKSLRNLCQDVGTLATEYAELSAQKAAWGANDHNYHHGYCQAISYHKIEAEWYKFSSNRNAERNARIKIAEAYIWYALKAIEFQEPLYWAVAAGRIESGIQKFKTIEDTFNKQKDTSEQIEQLHREMLNYQKKAAETIPHIPIEVDMNDLEMQKTAKNLSKGKSLEDSLYLLASCSRDLIKPVEELRQEANKYNDSGGIRSLIPVVSFDHEGKAKAIGKTGDEGLEDRMFESAISYQTYFGYNFMAPACEQICSEHNIKIEDLFFIVENNSFIPSGREHLYARGLLAGLQKDPIVAIHILVPQLENSLRHILNQRGSITSKSGSIQDDALLGEILRMPELSEILGQDIVFALRGLLVERMGSNIRNDLCHGLLSVSRFWEAEMLYLWWLILCLCLAPSFKQWHETQTTPDFTMLSRSKTSQVVR